MLETPDNPLQKSPEIPSPPEEPSEGEPLSRTEIQLEQEKLRLERERILLERERLDAARERLNSQTRSHSDANGRLTVAVSTTILVSIICTLMGGILGAVSMSVRVDIRSRARLQKVMDSLASVAPETLNVSTNQIPGSSGELPAWLETAKPHGSHAGISLIVIQ